MQPATKRERSDPDVRRSQILDEATRIIGERGYHGFAVQDLARRCGLTNGGLLYHFESKEALLLAVLRECDRRWEQALVNSEPARLFGDDPKSRDAVLAIFRNMMVLSARTPELVRLLAALSGEAMDQGHPAYGYLLEREKHTLGGYERLVSELCPDPSSVARQIHALSLGLEAQWLRAGLAFDLVAEWDRAIEKILPELEDEK